MHVTHPLTTSLHVTHPLTTFPPVSLSLSSGLARTSLTHAVDLLHGIYLPHACHLCSALYAHQLSMQ